MLFVGFLQHAAELAAVLCQHFHFLADVVNVLLQYLEGLSDAGRTDFQLIILILTVQLGLDVAAQLYTVLNPNTFFVVYFHQNLVIRADCHLHKEVVLSCQPLVNNLTNSFLFYHRLTIRNKKEELNRPSTFHPFSLAKI